ncbi:MAG: hypothetical protein WCO52_01410 [bacterium]
MNIGLDFDGVIADYASLKIRVSRELFGVEIPPEDMHGRTVVEKDLLSLSQYRAVQEVACTSPSYVLSMNEIPGAIKGITALQNMGTVRIITSRPGKSLEMARKWLSSHDITCECVGVGRDTSKQGALKEEAVFVDDDIEKLEHLKGLVPKLILFGQKYNRGDNTEGLATRIESWDELLSSVSA